MIGAILSTNINATPYIMYLLVLQRYILFMVVGSATGSVAGE